MAAASLESLRDYGDISVALTFFDRFLGNLDPWHTPAEPSDGGEPATWDLSAANQIEEWFLTESVETLQRVLGTAGMKITGVKPSSVEVVVVSLDGKQARPATKLELHKAILALERGLKSIFADPESFNKRAVSAAKASLSSITRLLSTQYKSLEALKSFKMKNLPLWDSNVTGLSATDMGLIVAYTGFMTSASEGIVTMPNFTQWDPESEFVTFCLKNVPEKNRSVPRLFRHMYLNCIRAPCHEAIHCAQHILGQKMTTQVAEHDAYYSCNILTQAISLEKEMQGIAYPGLNPELMLMGLSRMTEKLSRVDKKKWNFNVYHKWRDSFGIDSKCWNGKNFGSSGSLNDSMEFLAGPLLTLEACAPSGKHYENHQMGKLVADIVKTMFVSRDAATHPDAKLDERAKRKLVDCGKIEVKAPEMLRLNNLKFQDRLKSLLAPIGKLRGAAIVQKLDPMFKPKGEESDGKR
ncbi:hypothetical protein AAMO2058_001292100 [Amorphochlora amoebiformis]